MRIKKDCVRVVFESGHVLHIEPEYANWIFFCEGDQTIEERRRFILDFYKRMGACHGAPFRCISDAIKVFGDREIDDYDLIEWCLFKDIKEYGEDKICGFMAEEVRRRVEIDWITA